jgi:hypothetical protein
MSGEPRNPRQYRRSREQLQDPTAIAFTTSAARAASRALAIGFISLFGGRISRNGLHRAKVPRYAISRMTARHFCRSVS